MKIDFKEMLEMQKELDDYILRNGQVEGLADMKLVALTVELSEMFNEIRSFKHWSKKGPSSKEVILDEFADVLHFWLSIMNDEIKNKLNKDYINIDIKDYTTFDINVSKEIENKKNRLNELFIYIINCIVGYNNIDKTIGNLYNLMGSLLIIAEILEFTEQDIIDAYKEKHEINYKRQREGY